MSRSNRTTVAVELVAGLLALVGVALITMPIQKKRQELQLGLDPAYAGEMPPGVNLSSVVLGSFRGVALDYLWLRANRLEQEGKYYEAKQLARWITTLQPHLADVWEFQSWNMAYNISVAMDSPQERWMWVRAGIELLRDHGIPQNPRAPQLYASLAFTFLHKIGQFADESHWYFKGQFAAEWHALLGEPPAGDAKEIVAWFRPIAEAPTTLAKLIADKKYGPAVDEQVKRLSELGYKLDANFAFTVGRLEGRLHSLDLELLGLQDHDGIAEREDSLHEWLHHQAGESARQKLLGFVRAQVLRERYHMDPAFMLTLIEKYGPLDWRHPATHTVYWAAKGLKECRQRRRKDEFEMLNLTRHLSYGLLQLVRMGRLHFDPGRDYLTMTAEPRFISHVDETWDEVFQDFYAPVAEGGTPSAGRKAFLLGAIESYYLEGDRQGAQKLYAELRQEFGAAGGRYTAPLDKFIARRKLSDIKDISDASRAVSGLIRQGLLHLADGRLERAKHTTELARNIHRTYNSKQFPRQGPNELGRHHLPAFDQMLADTLANIVLFDDIRLAGRVWRNAPVEFKRRIFPRIEKRLYEKVKKRGLNPQVVFPPPEGARLAPQEAPLHAQ